MAQYDGSIRINTSIDQRGFERGSRGLIQGMTRLGNSLRGMVSSLGFGLGIAGLVTLGKQAIDTASDIQEVQNVVDTAFGSMSYKMEEFAKTSVKQFGISQLSAKQLGSTFMAMGASMLDSAETASDMAINLTARAADMASFYNKSIEETSTALKSIYTGETESLKEYGVVMTQVNLEEFARQQGINKSIQAMTQSEKVMLNYQYVMQQTSLAAGDFAKTSDSWANQTRILSEQFKELASVIGGGLIAALTPVVKFLNTILTMAIAVAKQIGALLGKLFGISVPIASAAKGTSDIATGMSNVADNADSAAGSAGNLKKGLDSAGKAAKKAGDAAKRSLAPFDKLTVLSKEASGAGSGGSGGGGSGGGGGAGGGGGFQMPQVEMKEETEEAGEFSDALDGIIEKLNELKGLFVGGFFEGLGDYKQALDDIQEDLDSIWETLKDIFTDTEVVSAADNFFNAMAFALGQVTGSFASIGLTIAENIIGGIEKYLTQNTGRIKQYIIDMFDIGSDIVSIIGDFSVAFADIFSVFGSDTAQQITGNIIGMFAEVGMMVSENAAKLGRDILNMITQPIIDNKDKIKTAIEGTLEAIEPFTSGLLTAVQTIRDAVADIYDNHLKPLFDSIAKGLSTILGNILDSYNKYVVPVLKGLGEKFKDLMEGPFGKAVDSIAKLVGRMIDILKILWESLLVPFFSWIGSTAMAILGKIVDIVGSAFIKAAEIAFNVISKIAEIATAFLTFLAEHKGIIEAVGAALIGMFAASKIVPAVTAVVGAVKGAVALFVGSGGLSAAIATIVSAVQGFIGILAGGGGLGAALSGIVAALGGPVTIAVGAVIAALILLITHFDEVKEVVGKVKDWIVEKWEEISSATSEIWETITTTISGFWDGLSSSASDIFDGIKGFVSDAWENAKKLSSDLWGNISTTVGDTWKNLKKSAGEVFPAIWGKVKTAWTDTWSKTKSAWTNVSSKVGGVWDAFKRNVGSVFPNIQRTITNAWNNIKTSTTNIWNGIKNAVKSPINAIIGFINKMISGIVSGINAIGGALGNLKIDIPDWVPGVGGNSLGFNIPKITAPQIPYLASGAVIRGGDPFMAVLGDQPRGQTNVEAPLATIEQAVSNAIRKNGGMGGGNITVQAILDGKIIYEQTVKQNNIEFKRTGKNRLAY